MASTSPTPTIKQVNLVREDAYRKQKMIEMLEARRMLDTAAKNFILSGRRKR
jgi:hypothetical protein